jgi:AcrR family transcriptional regulator
VTEPRRRRGRPATTGLSFERIVEAALVLLERDGLEALTTARLGRELGVAEKTIYGYIRSKEEILDAVGDALIGRLDLPEYDPGKDWTDQVVEQFVLIQRLLADHPAAARLFVTRHVVGAGTARLLERVLSLMQHGGLGRTEAVEAHRVLVSYAVGYSTYTSGHHLPDRELRWSSFLHGLPRGEFPTLHDSLSEIANPPRPDLYVTGLRTLVRALRPAGVNTL